MLTAEPTPDDGEPLRTLAARLRAIPRRPLLIAVDGHGGAGKSTFAHRLREALGPDTALLHTDDFASPQEPVDWWPRLLQVIEQLSKRQPATFEPYDWEQGKRLPPHTVAPADLVVIEGVSAGRRAWAEHLSFTIWIDADPALCRQRGMLRDGVTAQEWDREAEADASFFARDGVRERVDLVLDATDH